MQQSVIIQGGVAGEARGENTETNFSTEQTKHKTTPYIVDLEQKGPTTSNKHNQYQ